MSGIEGAYIKAKADEWVEAHPEWWAAMMRTASKFAAEKRRFSMERLFQLARYDMPEDQTRQQFKVNNYYRAPLARRMLEEHPEWARFIETRKSKVDGK